MVEFIDRIRYGYVNPSSLRKYVKKGRKIIEETDALAREGYEISKMGTRILPEDTPSRRHLDNALRSLAKNHDWIGDDIKIVGIDMAECVMMKKWLKNKENVRKVYEDVSKTRTEYEKKHHNILTMQELYEHAFYDREEEEYEEPETEPEEEEPELEAPTEA